MSGEELCKQPESDGRPHCDPIQHDSGWNYKGDLIWYKNGTNTFEPYPDDDPRQPWNFVLPDLPPLTIDFTNIKCVYRGEPGCACGCLGDYYYPEWHRDDWKKLRGWGPFKDEEVSDTQIIRVSLIVGKHLEQKGSRQNRHVHIRIHQRAKPHRHESLGRSPRKPHPWAARLQPVHPKLHLRCCV